VRISEQGFPDGMIYVAGMRQRLSEEIAAIGFNPKWTMAEQFSARTKIQELQQIDGELARVASLGRDQVTLADFEKIKASAAVRRSREYNRLLCHHNVALQVEVNNIEAAVKAATTAEQLAVVQQRIDALSLELRLELSGACREN
jgi:hypothetical protein